MRETRTNVFTFDSSEGIMEDDEEMGSRRQRRRSFRPEDARSLQHLKCLTILPILNLQISDRETLFL